MHRSICGCRTNNSRSGALLAPRSSDTVGRHKMSESAANACSTAPNAGVTRMAPECLACHSASVPSRSAADGVADTASGLSRRGGPSTPSAAPQSQPPHHALDDDTQEPGMACPRRAAAARLRAGGSRIGTNARKQPSPARGSSHAPDLCAGGVLMHPPVTYVGAPACPLARRSPCARATRALAASVGLRCRSWSPCGNCVYSMFAVL